MSKDEIVLPNRYFVICLARQILAQGVRSPAEELKAEKVLSMLHDLRMSEEDNETVDQMTDELEDALQTFTNNENHANWYKGNEPEEGWCPES